MEINKKVCNFYHFTLKELEDVCLAFGGNKYNARQLFEWVYKKNITSFEQISNISKNIIKKISQNISLPEFKLVDKLIDKKDGTVKFLFSLEDVNVIETVLMKFEWGNSICVSTEIGCNMGCKFCASGQLKLVRKLTVAEIIMQYVMVNKFCLQNNEKISHIVFMGIGEPLDNYENLLKAISILQNPYGINIGSRKITISTCGIIENIYKLSSDLPQVNLAISLHATNDMLRNKLMPINKAYSLDKLLSSIDYYIKKTNRRVTFEYLMLDGINDTDECLQELINIAKNRLCYINLIPYNNVIDTTFCCSKRIDYFKNQLLSNNITATVRLERGSNINAACGQLRANYEKRKI